MGQKTSTPHTHICTHTRPILIGKLPILFGGYFYVSFCFSRKKMSVEFPDFHLNLMKNFLCCFYCLKTNAYHFICLFRISKRHQQFKMKRICTNEWGKKKTVTSILCTDKSLKKLLTNTHRLCVSINIDRARNWSFSSWMRFLLLFLKIRRNCERMCTSTFNRWPIRMANKKSQWAPLISLNAIKATKNNRILINITAGLYQLLKSRSLCCFSPCKMV